MWEAQEVSELTSIQPHLSSGPSRQLGLPFPELPWVRYDYPTWEVELASHIPGLILSASSEGL